MKDTPVVSAKEVKVICVRVKVYDGNEWQMVSQWWTLDGQFIGERDERGLK